MSNPPTLSPPPTPTLHRIVFENGHCILAQQRTPEDYISILDEDVQKLAGSVLNIHDTGIQVTEEASISIVMENLCGNFRVTGNHVISNGEMGNNKTPRLGKLVKNRQFIGTHMVFHTVHGRLSYIMKRNTWSFKGCRSLEDLVKFVRDLTQDVETPMYPTVNMMSVTMRTNTHLVINPVNSLMHRMFVRLYAGVVSIHVRTDDANNLFFLNVTNWNGLLETLESTRGGSGVMSRDEQDDVKYVRGHLASAITHPTCSIGYTRSGVFFIRITFPDGLVCKVYGSQGNIDGVPSEDTPSEVSAGGINPFVAVVTKFIISALMRIRALG
jgi:hypothetical protein